MDKKCIMCGKKHSGKYGSPLCPDCMVIAAEASLNNKGIVIKHIKKKQVESKQDD